MAGGVGPSPLTIFRQRRLTKRNSKRPKNGVKDRAKTQGLGQRAGGEKATLWVTRTVPGPPIRASKTARGNSKKEFERPPGGEGVYQAKDL